MANKNLTELVFVLDRSGSMSGLEGDTLIMPKDIPHAVFGEERFKMQLTVSF